MHANGSHVCEGGQEAIVADRVLERTIRSLVFAALCRVSFATITPLIVPMFLC